MDILFTEKSKFRKLAQIPCELTCFPRSALHSCVETSGRVRAGILEFAASFCEEKKTKSVSSHIKSGKALCEVTPICLQLQQNRHGFVWTGPTTQECKTDLGKQVSSHGICMNFPKFRFFLGRMLTYTFQDSQIWLFLQWATLPYNLAWWRLYLIQCFNQMVLESQLPHKIFNLLLTIAKSD